MKTNHILLNMLLVCTILAGCTEIDNYDEPGETLTGSVIDEVTNQPIITEQPNGFRIKLSEISWSDSPQPEYFWGKADGTFNNTKIFKGTYEVSPVEGAFFPVDPVTTVIKGTTKLDFKVTPYLLVMVTNASFTNGVLNVSYKISRTKVGDEIIDARVFVSTNPNVGSNILINELSPLRDLSGINDTEILNTTFNETIEGFDPQKTYYMRVGARTNNTSRRYNFTEITEIKP